MALTHAAERAVRLLLWGRESVVVGACMQGERAVRLLLWGRESVVVGTCMLGERTVRVVVGTGSDGVVGWARAIRHAIRRTQMHSDAMIRRTWSDGVVGWASNASVRASMAVPDDGGN
jgi:hypothetical protein